MLDIAIAIAGVGLAVAAAICVLHVARARSSADRLVATDLLLGVVVMAFVLHAMSTRTTTLLPLAVVSALLGFVATTAAARFIERRGA